MTDLQTRLLCLILTCLVYLGIRQFEDTPLGSVLARLFPALIGLASVLVIMEWAGLSP